MLIKWVGNRVFSRGIERNVKKTCSAESKAVEKWVFSTFNQDIRQGVFNAFEICKKGIKKPSHADILLEVQYSILYIVYKHFA